MPFNCVNALIFLLLIFNIYFSGNIILHIFLEEVRAKYDIESCQLFDLEYDSGGNIEQDPMLKIIAEQMEFFNSLKQQQSSSEISKNIS